MPIPIICDCSAKLKVADHLKGQHIKCPRCAAILPVGTVNGSAAAAAPRPKAAPQTTGQVLEQSPLARGERELLEEQLERGERLVWADKPVEAVAFRRAWLISAGLFSMAVVFLVILIVLAVTTGSSGSGLIILVIVALLFVVALGAGFGFPYLEQWRIHRDFYALTSQRALVWKSNYAGRLGLQVYEPAALSGVRRQVLVKGAEDIGHLIFGSKVTSTRTDSRGTTQPVTYYGFFYIRRPAEVEKLLRETLVDPLLDRIYDE
jgi:hypothetical protein